MTPKHRHLQAGELLRLRGVERLAEHPIQNGMDAILAMRIGIAIERQCDELPDWVAGILTASPDELIVMQSDLKARRAAALKAGQLSNVEHSGDAHR